MGAQSLRLWESVSLRLHKVTLRICLARCHSWGQLFLQSTSGSRAHRARLDPREDVPWSLQLPPLCSPVHPCWL
jgi:hypothetical protein